MDKLMMNNGFYQRYMWFISLLLLFFVVFSLVYRVKKAWFEADYPATRGNPSVSSSLKLIGAVGSLCFASSMAAGGIVLLSGHEDPTNWFTLANIIQFQPVSLPVFLIYFVMGVVVNRNKWIERGKFPGHLNTWLISTGFLLIIYLFVLHAFLTAPVHSKEIYIYGFLTAPFRSLIIMSFLGFFSSLAVKYWNRPTRIDQNLASNSYDIYLSHYIFVFVFQLILLTIPGIPPLFKFMIVSTLSISCAYIASRFLIKPCPKVTVALSFILLIAMFVVIRP
jgi:glucan biosynthesis protein C